MKQSSPTATQADHLVNSIPHYCTKNTLVSYDQTISSVYTQLSAVPESQLRVFAS